MSSRSVSICLLVAAAGLGAAQLPAETLTLRNGNTIEGRIVSAHGGIVRLERKTGVKLTIPKDQVVPPTPQWLAEAQACFDKQDYARAAELCRLTMMWDGANEQAQAMLGEIERLGVLVVSATAPETASPPADAGQPAATPAPAAAAVANSESAVAKAPAPSAAETELAIRMARAALERSDAAHAALNKAADAPTPPAAGATAEQVSGADNAVADEPPPVKASAGRHVLPGTYVSIDEQVFELAVFVEKPQGAPAAADRQARDCVGAAVAVNWESLKTLGETALSLSEGVVQVREETPVSQLVHTVVIPREGTPLAGPFQAKKVACFTPLPGANLAALIASCGSAGRVETWDAASKCVGLAGETRWWGDVGVAADKRGTITHLLLRAHPAGKKATLGDVWK